jgi:hypothetical protein
MPRRRRRGPTPASCGTRRADPEALYGFYARHGESENWIKDFKLHITRRIV